MQVGWRQKICVAWAANKAYSLSIGVIVQIQFGTQQSTRLRSQCESATWRFLPDWRWDDLWRLAGTWHLIHQMRRARTHSPELHKVRSSLQTDDKHWRNPHRNEVMALPADFFKTKKGINSPTKEQVFWRCDNCVTFKLNPLTGAETVLITGAVVLVLRAGAVALGSGIEARTAVK